MVHEVGYPMKSVMSRSEMRDSTVSVSESITRNSDTGPPIL